VINTHKHFDHSGGLRTYLSQGTTIVTHETNKQYYLDILFDPAPRTLEPDRMAKFSPMFWISRRPAPIQVVSGEPRGTAQYGLGDADRLMTMYHVQDMSYELGDPSVQQGAHAPDMLMVYLPKEKILFNADLYSPPAQGAQLPTTPTASAKTLMLNIRKLKLDVERHAAVHGRVGTHEEFMRMFPAATTTN
jgi:glyoxylase-like metal-dependent hydrolase (beta-lactamase superfamily II)